MTDEIQSSHSVKTSKIVLERRLTLPLLILYGLGVTVGAGIYVLIGTTAARAGFYAPISFLLAALVVGFTGFTYCEFATRFPVSAGEAAYVRYGFNSRTLALIAGLMVVTSGVVSAAAISIGASAYMGSLVPFSPMILTGLIILTLGAVAAWGVLQSVILAAVFTVIEIGGLGFVVIYGFVFNPDLLNGAGKLIPPLEANVWAGITSAGLLAFFAFVGFEDIVNVAEEVKNPRQNMPRAIIITLFVATIIYLVVVSVVILVVPMDRLVLSAAPLELVFETASPAIKIGFSIVAIIATLNGVLIQMIMASRVLYGLAVQGNLPKKLAYIYPGTHTPLVATAIVVVIVTGLALFLPIGELARTTSQVVLSVFMLVNLALLRFKLTGGGGQEGFFKVPVWVPALGFLSCLLLLISGSI